MRESCGGSVLVDQQKQCGSAIEQELELLNDLYQGAATCSLSSKLLIYEISRFALGNENKAYLFCSEIKRYFHTLYSKACKRFASHAAFA